MQGIYKDSTSEDGILTSSHPLRMVDDVALGHFLCYSKGWTIVALH